MHSAYSSSLIMGDDAQVKAVDHTTSRDPFVVLAVPVDNYSSVRIHIRVEHLATWDQALTDARKLLTSAVSLVKAA